MKITTLFFTVLATTQAFAWPVPQDCSFFVKKNDALMTTNIYVGIDTQKTLTMSARIFDQSHPNEAAIPLASASFTSHATVTAADLEGLKYSLSNAESHVIPDELTVDQIGSIEVYQGVVPDNASGDAAELAKMNFDIILLKDKSGNLLKNPAGLDLKIALFFVTAQICGTTIDKTETAPPPLPAAQ